MSTSTIEDYLKAIYLMETAETGRPVNTGQIAEALSVAPGTVTSMLKTLANSGLVRYQPYAGAHLTAAGEKLAAHVLRRHRLVELFLVEVMGMCWSEVHEEAERLEHVISERILERMDEMLARPAFDPHGDPIPTAAGTVARTDYPDLLTCEPGRRHRVARVLDQGESFLQRLERHGVIPGRSVTVTGREEDTQQVVLETEGGKVCRLGFHDAARVLVQPDAVTDVHES